MEPIASSGAGSVFRPAGGSTNGSSSELTALLRHGRVLGAEVLSPSTDGTLLLAIGRHTVPAESELHLDPGQRFLVRVAETAAGVVLEKLAAPPGGDAVLLAALRAAVGDGRPLGEAVGRLQQVLRASTTLAPELRALALGLATHLASTSSAGGLHALLSYLGLGHEAGLAALPGGAAGRAAARELAGDLKSALLRALAVLDGASGERVELRESVQRALSGLEAEQLLNVARERAGEPLVFSFPFPDGDGWTTARLSVPARRHAGEEDEESEHAGEEAPFRLALGLELTALGPLRADLALGPRLLSVRLLVTRLDAAARIEAGLGALRERLAGGRQAVELHVRHGTAAEAALGLAPLDIRYLRENHLMNVEG